MLAAGLAEVTEATSWRFTNPQHLGGLPIMLGRRESIRLPQAVSDATASFMMRHVARGTTGGVALRKILESEDPSGTPKGIEIASDAKRFVPFDVLSSPCSGE
jgi:hypothetical protein